MTITTPPSETRRRGLRRGGDTASPARRTRSQARSDGSEDPPATGASARVGAKGGSASPPRDRPAGKKPSAVKKSSTGTRKPPAEKRASRKTTVKEPASGRRTGPAAPGTSGAAKRGRAGKGVSDGARTTASATATAKSRTDRTAPGPARRGKAPVSAKTATGAPTRRPARTTSPERPARRAARQAEPPRARAPFVLLVVGLLGGALVSLLLLNTVLAQDAFTLSQLQRDNRRLAERKQALEADIARESDPAVLRQKALGLGLVDSQAPAFIDARTGRVIEGGSPPPGVSDDAAAAAAAGGLTGAPGAIVPPAGGADPQNPQKTTGPQAPGGKAAATPGRNTRPGGGTR